MSPLEQLLGRIEQWSGINVDRRNASLPRIVQALAQRHGFADLEGLAMGVYSTAHPAAAELINAVTVGYTWFFRDAVQLEGVRALLEGMPAHRPLGLWVPGCATGEDAFSLAMVAAQAQRPCQVLGTDINSEALARAEQARYGEWSVREVPPRYRAFLLPEPGGLQVVPLVRGQVSFARHNLMDPPPRPAGAPSWDLILCRNVLFYFSKERAQAAIERLGQALSPGGWLVLGAADLLTEAPAGLKLMPLGGEGRFALQRLRKGEAQPPLQPGPAPTPAPLALRSPEPPSPVALLPVTPPAPARELPEQDWLSRANAQLESGRAQEALALYAQAAQADPLDPEAHFLTGVAFHLSGDPVSAAGALRNALFLDPKLWPAAFYLALTYENLGRASDARREYARVLELSSTPWSLRQRTALFQDIEAWKEEVVSIAARRAGR